MVMSFTRNIVIAGGIAPVLIIPDVLDRDLCRRLIAHFEETGGEDSGFMNDRDGRTIEFYDYSFKRRRDRLIADQTLTDALTQAYAKKVRPRIREAFHIDVTRIERHVVARYDSATADHFAPHRDNTKIASRHRQFACTINLNTDEYEGGSLRFPDFGPFEYRCPTGAALIFSCGLLHEARPVTSGRRYATLPFFYDEASSVLREQTRSLIGVNPSEQAAA
jgi:predicted 2-oxoglutarate/Fe(II)-dependent dioxygenase YbiX